MVFVGKIICYFVHEVNLGVTLGIGFLQSKPVIAQFTVLFKKTGPRGHNFPKFQARLLNSAKNPKNKKACHGQRKKNKGGKLQENIFLNKSQL